MPIFAMNRVKVERIILFVKIVNRNFEIQKKVLRLASEKFVLASGTNPVTSHQAGKLKSQSRALHICKVCLCQSNAGPISLKVIIITKEKSATDYDKNDVYNLHLIHHIVIRTPWLSSWMLRICNWISKYYLY